MVMIVWLIKWVQIVSSTWRTNAKAIEFTIMSCMSLVSIKYVTPTSAVISHISILGKSMTTKLMIFHFCGMPAMRTLIFTFSSASPAGEWWSLLSTNHGSGADGTAKMRNAMLTIKASSLMTSIMKIKQHNQRICWLSAPYSPGSMLLSISNSLSGKSCLKASLTYFRVLQTSKSYNRCADTFVPPGPRHVGLSGQRSIGDPKSQR
mmetsp:Transcript_56562/g.132686  ORF Transcript_56562/g.132686 Transcript_56562/m.132686 type:complete len:206 (+) Transcript_56562:332-949(+)